MKWEIRKYQPADAPEWDRFVASSRNATFLFYRGYMDYHADRFRDCSMMAFKDGRLLAVLPANLDAWMVLHSHQGLTYGGWVLPVSHLDAADFLYMWEAWLDFCRSLGIREIDYKPLPYIYSAMPSQEDEYMLFRSDAVISERNLSATICMSNRKGFNTLQRRHLRKAEKMGFEIRETADCGPFVEMLEECLRERHDAAPVHSQAELAMLMKRFPENIRIFEIYSEGSLMAGVCVYVTETVAHCQYIASTAEGRARNMLTPLFNYLITKEFADKRWFDFGTSNEDHGRVLNEGLIRQKSALGGTGVAYTRYTIPLQ